MKKELNYLTLPDHFNKFILNNFNQKIKIKTPVLLQFKLSNINHLGSALKAIYLLEIVFPKKSFVFRLILKKKKKIYFGQKVKKTVFFTFNLNLSSSSFIDFYRFFSNKPLNKNKSKLEDNIIINKKLKQFEFNNKIFLNSQFLDSSYIFLNAYHLN